MDHFYLFQYDTFARRENMPEYISPRTLSVPRSEQFSASVCVSIEENMFDLRASLQSFPFCSYHFLFNPLTPGAFSPKMRFLDI